MSPHYRGWRSTKLHLALISMALVSAGWVATGCSRDLFGTACTALIAAAGIYSGAAMAEKFTK